MPFLIAAVVVIVGLIAYFLGESNGKENEAGKPRTICRDVTLVGQTATHGDYAGSGTGTHSLRKDEIAAALHREITEFPPKLRICVTIAGGQVTTEVTAP